MKNPRFVQFGMLTMLIAFSLSLKAQFNSNPTLKIGDLAPPIQVAGWARGEQLTQFEKGKVYVVDFWATWCGGCIASFPHISAIAEKYKDKVHFISVDSYEDVGDRKNEDPMVVVKDFLKTPQGKRLTIDVAVDGKSNMMFNNWIKTIRRQGFPTTFIINQEGKIAWVDVNLDHLDWVLKSVLAKTWDINKAAAVMKQRDALEDQMFAIFRATGQNGKVGKEQLIAYQKMLNDAKALEKQFPDRKDAAAFYKLLALNELDKTAVPAHLEEMAADPLSRNISMSDGVYLTLRRTDLTKKDYAAVAKVQERLLLNQHSGTGYGGKSIKAYEQLAASYSKAGNHAKAIISIEKAIAMAKQEKTSAAELKKLYTSLSKYKQVS